MKIEQTAFIRRSEEVNLPGLADDPLSLRCSPADMTLYDRHRSDLDEGM